MMALSRRENEDEVVPLNVAPKGSNTSTAARFGLAQRFVGFITIVAMIALMFILGEKKEEERATPLETRGETHAKIPLKQCPKFCQARLAQRIHHQGGDLLKPQDLIMVAIKARETMVQTLKTNYGEDVFKAMFEEADGMSRGHSAIFGASDDAAAIGPSKGRFRRKLKIKVLKAQLEMRKRESNVLGCDCSSTSGRRLENQNPSQSVQVSLPELPLSYSSFVWATGGHSAAAGHGNLYNESYTAYLERTVKDVFGAVGIDFAGRNYAMGGMSSAPEIAMCQESLFGIDADLISWDFGMTDGKDYFKKLLYANRIGMHRNRPVVFDVNIAGNLFNQRRSQLTSVEERGVSAMYISPPKWLDVEKGIPDMSGMSSEEMAKVAPWARHFKCNNALEKGDPTCGRNKYNDAICAKRMHKTSWHPGWHVNAAYGSLMGLFLSDELIDAITELRTTPYDPEKALSVLLAEEDAEYTKFYKSKPGMTEAFVQDITGSSDTFHMDLITKIFRTARVICHTALLPSQIRYFGILTETDMIGTHDYDKGVSQQSANGDKATEAEKDSRHMRLVYDTTVRQPECPVDLKWDYKDFFYTTQHDGWTSLTVPNDAEMTYYIGDHAYEPEGLIMICFVACDWGKCPSGNMQFDQISDGTLKFEVNGVAVTNVTRIRECGILRNDSDGYNFKANSDGRFEIRVLVDADPRLGEAYTRITSIVVV